MLMKTLSRSRAFEKDVSSDQIEEMTLRFQKTFALRNALKIARANKEKGIPVEERPLSIDELEEAYKNGNLKEMFAAGTAAIVSPVGELLYKGDNMIINNNEIGPIAQEMYNTIYGIQTGKLEDFMGWTEPVE